MDNIRNPLVFSGGIWGSIIPQTPAAPVFWRFVRKVWNRHFRASSLAGYDGQCVGRDGRDDPANVQAAAEMRSDNGRFRFCVKGKRRCVGSEGGELLALLCPDRRERVPHQPVGRQADGLLSIPYIANDVRSQEGQFDQLLNAPF